MKTVLHKIESYYSGPKLPKVNDIIEFADDTLTDKGPASGKVIYTSTGFILCTCSDTIFKILWDKLCCPDTINIRKKKNVWILNKCRDTSLRDNIKDLESL